MDDLARFFKQNPQALVLLVICLVLGLGTFLVVVAGVAGSGSTVTNGQPAGLVAGF